MDRSYWQEIVGKLHERSRCEWAAHVLATDLDPSRIEETNLGAAIQATSAEEVIEGVLTAFQDWSAQPACDSILRYFGELIVPAAMRSLESNDALVRRGGSWSPLPSQPRYCQGRRRDFGSLRVQRCREAGDRMDARAGAFLNP